MTTGQVVVDDQDIHQGYGELSALRLMGLWGLLFAGVLVIDIGFSASIGDGSSTDYTSFYRPVAERLVAGQGLTETSGDPALRYPPGYAVLLTVPAFISRHTGIGMDGLVFLFRAATVSLTGVVLFVLHRERYGRRAGWAGLLLWFTYPVLAWMTAGPIVDVPYTFVLAITALVASRTLLRSRATARSAATLGALIGVGALIRPNGVVVIVPAALALWWASRSDVRSDNTPGEWTRAVAPIGVLVVAAATITLPWVIWSSVRRGELVPMSTNGPATIRAGLEVGSGRDEETGTTWIPSAASDFATRAARQPRPDTTGEIMSYLVHESRSHPGETVAMFGMKSIRSWYGTDSFRWDNLIAVVQVVYLALIAWGVTRSRDGPGTRCYTAFVLTTTVLFWVTCIAVVSIVRYMVPVLTLLIWLAPLGPISWLDHHPGSRAARALRWCDSPH